MLRLLGRPSSTQGWSVGTPETNKQPQHAAALGEIYGSGQGRTTPALQAGNLSFAPLTAPVQSVWDREAGKGRCLKLRFSSDEKGSSLDTLHN